MDAADQCFDVVGASTAALVIGVGPRCRYSWFFVDLLHLLSQKSDQVDRFVGVEVPVWN